MFIFIVEKLMKSIEVEVYVPPCLRLGTTQRKQNAIQAYKNDAYKR